MSMILMVAALAAHAAPAQTTAPVRTDADVVQCALKNTPRTDIVLIQRAMLEGVTAGAKPTADSERRLAALRERAAACNPGTGAADARAAEVVVASVATETLSTALQRQGSDVPAINAKLRATPPAILDAVLAQKRDARVDAFASEVISIAGGRPDPTLSRLIGGYVFNAVRLAKLFAGRPR